MTKNTNDPPPRPAILGKHSYEDDQDYQDDTYSPPPRGKFAKATVILLATKITDDEER